MIERIVPVIIDSTGEVVGSAKVSPVNEEGKMNASIVIQNHELLAKHKGMIKLILD